MTATLVALSQPSQRDLGTLEHHLQPGPKEAGAKGDTGEPSAFSFGPLQKAAQATDEPQQDAGAQYEEQALDE